MKKIISALLVFVLFLSMSMPIMASGKYIWPLIGYTTITSDFGYRNDPFTGEWKGHGGTDIGAPYGTPVYASSSGNLTIGYSGCTHNYSGQCGCGYTYGNFVYVDDDYGMRVYYAHLTSITASAGRVEQGQQIGTVGSTGNSTGSHLHFEMRTGTASSTRVDPLNYVNSSNQIGSPDTEAPKNVNVSANGLDVTVSWDSVANANSYDVYLVQSPWTWSDIKYSQSVTGTSHTFTNVEPGTYKAFVISRPNSTNDIQSIWVEFVVYPPIPPTNVVLSVDKSLYATGETICFSASSQGAKGYTIGINKDGERVYTGDFNSTYETFFSESGIYTAYVTAWNDIGAIDSSTITFTIYSDIGANVYAYIKHPATEKWLSNTNGNIEGNHPTGNANQIWNFVRQSDGSYMIKNMLDNSYMDVWGTSTESGTNIYCCGTYTGDVNQRFFIYRMYDAYYFRPAYTNMHLDMSYITYNLELWGAGENWEPQEFDIQIIDENGHLPQNIGNDFYAYIDHQSTGKYLTNVGGNIEGSNSEGNAEQIWNFIRQFDGSYVIKNTLDGSYMDVWGASTESGANVYCCGTYTGDVNQRFFIYHMYDAYYFRPVYTNMRLDMSSVNYNLELWSAGENWEPQEFDIQIIDENGHLPQNIGNDFYATIKNESFNKYLTNSAGNIEGQDESSNSSQLWNFIRQHDGSYVIKNMLDNSYMDVWATSTESGTNIYCCGTYTGDVNQRFFIYRMYDAYYFRPVYTNMHLDMSSINYNLELWGAGADWGPQEFEIKTHKLNSEIYFQAESATNVPETIKKTYGLAVTISNTIPIKENYKFLNWNTKANGTGTTYYAGDVYEANESVTLYAQWEPKKLTPRTISCVTKSDAMYTINVDAENFTEPYYIIIAGYKNGKLATTKIVPYDKQNSPYILNGDFDEIKVMVWRDFITMQPICDVEVIPSNEFIIE